MFSSGKLPLCNITYAEDCLKQDNRKLASTALGRPTRCLGRETRFSSIPTFNRCRPVEKGHRIFHFQFFYNSYSFKLFAKLRLRKSRWHRGKILYHLFFYHFTFLNAQFCLLSKQNQFPFHYQIVGDQSGKCKRRFFNR